MLFSGFPELKMTNIPSLLLSVFRSTIGNRSCQTNKHGHALCSMQTLNKGKRGYPTGNYTHWSCAGHRLCNFWWSFCAQNGITLSNTWGPDESHIKYFTVWELFCGWQAERRGEEWEREMWTQSPKSKLLLGGCYLWVHESVSRTSCGDVHRKSLWYNVLLLLFCRI